MSVTSSTSRRPFGKPWRSPASTPSLLGLAVGGIAVLSRSRSARLSPVKVKGEPSGSLTPVSRTETRSLRPCRRSVRERRVEEVHEPGEPGFR